MAILVDWWSHNPAQGCISNRLNLVFLYIISIGSDTVMRIYDYYHRTAGFNQICMYTFSSSIGCSFIACIAAHCRPFCCR